MSTSKPMSQEINDKRGGASSMMGFLEGIKSEFSRVTWTGRDELLSYTMMVVMATFIAGFAVFGVDLLIQNLLSMLGLSY